MNQNMQFNLRYPKLTNEGILRSFLCGLGVGFGADFVLGMIFWFSGIENLAIVIVGLVLMLAAATAGAATLFYYKKFKPTVTENARRIDKLGLEERVITMIEYKDDPSIIAGLQREDALKALEQVDDSMLQYEISKKTLISLIVSSVLGLAMAVVACLSAAGLLPHGSDFIKSILPEEPPVYIPVSYVAEDGGYIEGLGEQLVLMGENADSVTAIPDEGYTFEGWDDGYMKPTRQDLAIDHPLVLFAIFVPIEDDGDDGDEGSMPSQNGEQPGEQEGEGGSPGETGEPGQEPGEDGEEQIGEGSSKHEQANQIIDGNKYYREFLEEYREEIEELLKKKTDELTEEERAIIEAYINIV